MNSNSYVSWIVLSGLFCALPCALPLTNTRLVAAEDDSTIKHEAGKQIANVFSFTDDDGKVVKSRYLLFTPENDGDQAALPLMMFLHGSGERGKDLEKVKQWGPPKIVESKSDFPFVLISPQCPEGRRWNPRYLGKLIDHVNSQLKIDTNRVYMTGLSMGGQGSYAMLAKHGTKIAAAAVICGASKRYEDEESGRLEWAKKISDVPLWIFHGDADTAVKVSHTQKLQAALRQLGAEPTVTIYPGVGHNSWEQTYANPKVYEWLLSHTLDERPIRFEMKVLTIDTNEGCDIGDIDGDGRLDVVAGRNWFRNGDWLPRPVRTFGDKNGYAQSNADFVYDVDKDGQLDIIAGGFFDPDIHWYKNPGGEKLIEGHLWEKKKLATTEQTANEFSLMHDFDGNGTREWISNSWNKNSPLKIWELTTEKGKSDKDIAKLVSHDVGPANGHGMGFGDLNNDGRTDILVGTGWYEGPADGFRGEWKLHSDWEHQFSCPMIVRDINGDNVNDIVWGNPHDFGLFVWLGKGIKDGKWTYEEKKIDDSFSQAHCIHFADLDGDGKEELISGKRVRAHNGNDPGSKDPPVICYFKMNDEQEFERHIIHRGQAGIGLQIRSGDIDNDGDIDLVCAGKDGTEIFFNQRK